MEISPFDRWVAQWTSKGPPPSEQIKLATQMCERASAPYATITPNRGSEKTDLPLVSWNGVRAGWFTEVFMNLPEMQAFQSFGCRMWFFRNRCIPQLLRGLACHSGSVVDNLHMFRSSSASSSSSIRTTENLPAVAKATRFISYTGHYSISEFAELVKECSSDDDYIWMDALCVCQFAWTERNDSAMIEFKKDFMNELRKSIGLTRTTSLLLTNWDDIMLTIGRIWVLWEIFSCVDGTSNLEIWLPASEKQRFLIEGLGSRDGFESINASLSTVDVREASAFDPKDKDLILGLIEEQGGVHKVNSSVLFCIRTWLLDSGKAFYESLRTEGTRLDGYGNNLSVLCKQLGRASEAEQYSRESIAYCIERFGEGNPETVGCEYTLANILRIRGKFDEAQRLFERLIDDYSRLFGNDSGKCVDSKFSLAAVLHDKGEYEQSEHYFREALAGREVLSGVDSPATLDVKSGLATVLMTRGKLDEALLYHREAATGQAAVLGARHLTALGSLNNVGLVLWKLGRYEQAEEELRIVLRGKTEQLGTDHTSTLRTANNLGLLLLDASEKLDECEALLRRTLDVKKRELGEGHFSTLETGNNLARLFTETARLEEADQLLTDVLAQYDRSGNAEHPNALLAANNMAAVLLKLDKIPEAEDTLRRVWMGYRNLVGMSNTVTLTVASNLGNTICLAGRIDEGRQMMEESLRSLQRNLGNDHPRIAQVRNMLAKWE